MPTSESRYPNLRPWKPGQCGNPKKIGNGRKRLATDLVKSLDRKSIADLEAPGGKTFREAIVAALLRQCIQGNINAIRTVFDRVDGIAILAGPEELKPESQEVSDVRELILALKADAAENP